jgi:hypothetical protein
MGLKENIQTTADNVKHGFKHAAADVKDAANEVKHRSEADAEKTKRDVAGDQLTPGEYAGSVVKESVSRTKAGVDQAKRNVRDGID